MFIHSACLTCPLYLSSLTSESLSKVPGETYEKIPGKTSSGRDSKDIMTTASNVGRNILQASTTP